MARVTAANTATVRAGAPKTRAKRPFEAKLKAAVSRANADYTLRYLQRADPKIAATAAALLGALAAKRAPDNLLDARAMTKWAVKQFEAVSPRQAPAVREFLSEHLYSTRLGEDVEWRFGVRKVELGAVKGPPARGALFDATAIARQFQSRARGHSIKDVGSYVNEWLPRFAIDELERGKAELWVMEGSRDAALARARADGFTSAYRIETPGAFGANELYLALDAKTGRKRYLFAEVQGDSSIATLLRVAGISGAGAAAPVKLVTDVASRKSTQLISAYESLRPYAGTTHAIIGFKNTVLDELWKRKVLAEAAGLPRLPTHEQMKQLEQRLASGDGAAARELRARLEDSSPLIRTPRADPLGGEAWDGGMISARDAAGKPVRLALLRTPYGDNAGSFVSALAELGAKDLAVIGTAGGLGDKAKVGDIIVPQSVIGPDGKAKTFENRVAPFLTDGDGERIVEKAAAATLHTPLDETLTEIERMRARGDDAVELELSSIVTAGSGARLSAAFVVSDVPGSRQTLEAQAPDELDDSVGLALDGLLEALGIADVELPAAAAPVRKAPATAREALAAIAKAAGLERTDFVDRWAKLWGKAPFSELDVPYEVILRHGRDLSDNLITLFAATRSQWDVPGVQGVKLTPERLLTAEATSFDALALELDARRRKQAQPSSSQITVVESPPNRSIIAR